jgi:Arc/MetJ-type ribon-helix-helix transcriptional regulator
MTSLLTKALTEASRRLSALLEAEQDAVARRLLEQLDRWQSLRAHIEASEASGPLAPLDMDAVIAEARRRRGKP